LNRLTTYLYRDHDLGFAEGGGVRDIVCCYTVNRTYLFYALVSALQLRSAIAQTEVEILIVCYGSKIDEAEAVESFCRTRQISIKFISEEHLQGFPILCARLFLNDVVPDGCKTIIYLDADTQIHGSIEPLINVDVKGKSMLAAPDLMALIYRHNSSYGREARNHFNKLGLKQERNINYFNSGVIKASITEWVGICHETKILIKKNISKYKYLDQDALNVVVGDSHGQLSLKWNFPGFFINAFQSSINPTIYHFMSKPRPYDGNFSFFDKRFHDPYVALCIGHPELRSLYDPAKGLRLMKYKLKGFFKAYSEKAIWESEDLKSNVIQVESSSIV
jgi:lipopolysaccharide biosynthesis glycosyltransferase